MGDFGSYSSGQSPWMGGRVHIIQMHRRSLGQQRRRSETVVVDVSLTWMWTRQSTRTLPLSSLSVFRACSQPSEGTTARLSHQTEESQITKEHAVPQWSDIEVSGGHGVALRRVLLPTRGMPTSISKEKVLLSKHPLVTSRRFVFAEAPKASQSVSFAQPRRAT